MLTFHIITLFPEIYEPYFSVSVLGRARKRGLIRIKTYQLRDFALGKHKIVDDKPYGGGAGMVLMAEPILKAVSAIKSKIKSEKSKIILLSAKGKQFSQGLGYQWAKKYNQFILISGRYEGIDERVKKILKAEEIAIGPYVLTDGDLPAMAVISTVSRLIPGVIKLESLQEESYWGRLLKNEIKNGLEYPHYTRPEIISWQGKKYCVPRILLSGHHREIEAWRKGKRRCG